MLLLLKQEVLFKSCDYFSFCCLLFTYANQPKWYDTFYGGLFFACAWVINTYFSEAMELIPEMKGVSASLLTSFRLLIAAVAISNKHFL